jgi:hypothetical protein
MLVHDMEVDAAFWSVGLLVLTGASPREGWRRVVSPMLVTLLLAVAINVLGLSAYVPAFIKSIAHSLGVCAGPIGVVTTGVSLAEYLDHPARLLHRNIALAACAVRLVALPALMLAFTRWGPGRLSSSGFSSWRRPCRRRCFRSSSRATTAGSR